MEELWRELQMARSIAVLTGAGVTSGTGAARALGGRTLAAQFGPADLATGQQFAQNPAAVWQLFQSRRALLAARGPDKAHLALAELERRKTLTLLTLNTDDLHERAGSRKVVKLRGDLWWMRCTKCGRPWRDGRAVLAPLPPVCACGGIARPGVTWFDEPVPETEFKQAEAAVRSAGLLLVAGVTARLVVVAQLAAVARRAGCRLVELQDPAATPSGAADCTIAGDLGDMLEAAVSRVRPFEDTLEPCL
ncbi:MAG: NAD-dependent deacylase [Bryobacterales bacterium]|nr:NAD-dependent deacylase [Bryobacterales bacterium]